MMKSLGVLLLVGMATPALGSYLESCDFSVVIEDAVEAPALDEAVSDTTPLVKLAIMGAADLGSHDVEACSARVGTSQWLTLSRSRRILTGQHLVIDYFFVSSMTPDGVAKSESWNVVEGRQGTLVTRCWQPEQQEPGYAFDLRRMENVDQSAGFVGYLNAGTESVFSETTLQITRDEQQEQIVAVQGDQFAIVFGERTPSSPNPVIKATLTLSQVSAPVTMYCQHYQ